MFRGYTHSHFLLMSVWRLRTEMENKSAELDCNLDFSIFSRWKPFWNEWRESWLIYNCWFSQYYALLESHDDAIVLMARKAFLFLVVKMHQQKAELNFKFIDFWKDNDKDLSLSLGHNYYSLISWQLWLDQTIFWKFYNRTHVLILVHGSTDHLKSGSCPNAHSKHFFRFWWGEIC